MSENETKQTRRPSDVFGWAGNPHEAELVFDADQPNRAERDAIEATLREIMASTTDRDPKEVFKRALGVYRAIVACAKGGGSAQLNMANGTTKKLKVRLR